MTGPFHCFLSPFFAFTISATVFHGFFSLFCPIWWVIDEGSAIEPSHHFCGILTEEHAVSIIPLAALHLCRLLRGWEKLEMCLRPMTGARWHQQWRGCFGSPGPSTFHVIWYPGIWVSTRGDIMGRLLTVLCCLCWSGVFMPVCVLGLLKYNLGWISGAIVGQGGNLETWHPCSNLTGSADRILGSAVVPGRSRFSGMVFNGV